MGPPPPPPLAMTAPGQPRPCCCHAAQSHTPLVHRRTPASVDLNSNDLLLAVLPTAQATPLPPGAAATAFRAFFGAAPTSAQVAPPSVERCVWGGRVAEQMGGWCQQDGWAGGRGTRLALAINGPSPFNATGRLH